MRFKITMALFIIAGVAVTAFYLLTALKGGKLVKIDQTLPQIGDSFYLSYREYQPPLKTWDGAPNDKKDIEEWMLLDKKQVVSTLTYSQFKALCSPELLSSTGITPLQYEETIKIAKTNRHKSGEPVRDDILYFLAAEANYVQYVAVCSVLRGAKSYRFFKKTGPHWQYDVFNYQANPFSVLPYSDLDAIKEIVATGKAKVDEKGKLRPISGPFPSK